MEVTKSGYEPLAIKAYKALKRDIITLKYKPGEALDERKLERDLRLGRTPIREALFRLEAENLVEIQPKKSTVVRNITIQDLKDFFEIYMELERMNARLAAERITASELEQMRLVHKEIHRAITEKDYFKMTVKNTELHKLIADASKNQYLRRALHSLYNEGQRLSYISFSHDSQLNLSYEKQLLIINDQHALIIHHLEARDGENLESAIIEHVKTFRNRIFFFLSSGSFLD